MHGAGTTHRLLLPVSLAAPGLARRTLDTVEELEPYPDVLFAAQLLSSELLANSVRHAGLAMDEAITLSVECGVETLRVEVTDGGVGFNALSALAEHARSDQRYRGIYFVNALADRWGFLREDGGCHVWFEIDIVPGRRPWRGRERISETRPAR
jgi:anti-sigma regulatory factor (Ser/Thr protein kinase)